MSGLGNQGAYDLRLVKDVLAEKDAEIARLKDCNNSLRLAAVEYRQLITKLTDALEKANPTDRYRNLLQRVRETK